MTKAGGKSKLTAGAVAAVALAVLGAPAAATGADPGVDEYTQRAPDAKGERKVGSKPPVARPQDLPAPTREALDKQPDGPALAQIATARELGAPPPTSAATPVDESDDDGDRSPLSAATNALGVPGLLLLIAALAALGWLAYSRRHNDRGADS